MSDNFYATKTEVIVENLDENGLSKTVSVTTRIHIGKSLERGAFMLHIYPGLGILSEDGMMARLAEDGWKIQSDLYGSITLDMLQYNMKLPEAPVERCKYRVGSSHNCDYYTKSFS